MSSILRLAAAITIAAVTAVVLPAQSEAPQSAQHQAEAAISQQDLLGVWVSVRRAPGGIGSIWNFLPGGKLEISQAAIVEGWYKVEGDQLMMPPATTGPDAKPIVMRFRVQGDTLYQNDATGETRFSRVGKQHAGDPPIVGIWRAQLKASPADIAESQRKAGHPIDEHTAQALADIADSIYHEYTRDGLSKIRVPMRTVPGTYDLANHTFSIQTRGPAGVPRTIPGKFRLQNGLLILTQTETNLEDTYIRGDATKEELKRAAVHYGDSKPQLDPP